MCAIQLNAGSDIEANLATIERLVDDAVAVSDPQLVLTPEYSAFLADQADMPSSAAHFADVGSFFAGLARRHGIVVQAGSVLEPGSPRSFNTSLVYGPDGALLATYQKLHLFDMELPGGAVYRESDVLQRGSGIVTYDVGDVTVGCSICYDMRFPTLYRRLRDAGAQVIVVPSAFTQQTGMAHWHVLLRARAIETGCYVVAAAQWGTYGAGGRANYGHSLVVDPWGVVIAEASDGDRWITATIDTALVDEVRAKAPVHQHHVLD